MTQGLIKNYIGTWVISNFFKYDVFMVNAGRDSWFEAIPKTPGLITRTGENKTVLKILLDNDVINHLKFQQRVR